MVGRSHEGKVEQSIYCYVRIIYVFIWFGQLKRLRLLSSTLDDFPSTIQHLPILTEAKTKFTTAADVDRQVSEALSSGNSLYNLDVDQLKALQPSVIVTQVKKKLYEKKIMFPPLNQTFYRQFLKSICSSPFSIRTCARSVRLTWSPSSA